MHIVGITGTLGAGKGEVVTHLLKKGFLHFSARKFLLEEVRRRGLPEDRDSTNFVGEDLRRIHGASYVLENLLTKAREKGREGRDCVLESVRTVGEIEFLRKEPNFFLLAVDANPTTRFERIHKRMSSLDHVTYEKFLADERRESISKNPAEMNLPACIALADAVIMNNGSREEFYAEVDKVLPRMLREVK